MTRALVRDSVNLILQEAEKVNRVYRLGIALNLTQKVSWFR